MANEPIDELNYIGGVTVVDIGDLRVSRGLTRRPIAVCKHLNMSYDPKERRIWCRDCEQDIDNFDAFRVIVEQYDSALRNLQRRQTALKEAEAFQVRSIAAKKIDKAWRSKNMVPACPHCSNGLFPEDFKNGMAMLGKDYASARLGRKLKEQPNDA